MPERAAGFGIYIHWPFCAAKCPYCDFNSHVRRAVDHDAWRAALLTDLRHQADLSDTRTVTSIFFGGGTPSLMQPATVGALIDEVASLWDVADDLEITLEANPTSVEADKFKAFRSAGVNRVSMGIQALNDPDLKALGRMHSAAEAMAAFDVARSQFERVSFDLIYARQNQTLRDWQDELAKALAMAVDHLSLYQLTIEPGTRFGELYSLNKLRDLPGDDLGADLYDATQSLCAAAGMPSYEISNYARSDAMCRHNLTYWRYGPYLGVGPGAHGRMMTNGERFETASHSNPEAWLSAVAERGTGLRHRTKLSPSDMGTEYALMSMRLAEGMSLNRFQTLSGRIIGLDQIGDLISRDYIEHDEDMLRATPKGRPVLNSLLQQMLA